MSIVSSDGRPRFWHAFYNWANKCKLLDVFFSSYEIASILSGVFLVIDIGVALCLAIAPILILLIGAAFYKEKVFGNQVWIESVYVRFRNEDMKRHIILRRFENTSLSINIILGESITSWSFRLRWDEECLVKDPFFRGHWKKVTGIRDRVFCCWAKDANRSIQLKFNLTATIQSHFVPEVILNLEYSTNENTEQLNPTVGKCKNSKYRKLQDFVGIIVPPSMLTPALESEEVL